MKNYITISSFPVIYEALTTQKHSLQVLPLEYGYEGPFINEGFCKRTNQWSSRSLLDFTRLREVDLPLEFFRDDQIIHGETRMLFHEMLPKSLEKLGLRDFWDSEYAVLERGLCALLSCRKTRFSFAGEH